jgi:hypothetical protein
MPKSSKQPSARATKLAAQTLNNESASQVARRLAGSVLSQSGNRRQTGSELEDVASQVLKSDKYSKETKTLAGSVLSQANRKR